MENGTEVVVSDKSFKIGSQVKIASKTFQVYNTMPGLQLVGFAKVSKTGKMLNENMSLSFDQIADFINLGVIA